VKSLVLALAVFVFGCANKPASHECASGIVCPDPLQCAAVQPVCISNSCGDGVVDQGEVCDDGNIINGDGCAADCKSAEACGDGVTNREAGEVCDDGNTVAGDGCSRDCRSNEVCGNGITDLAKGEVCDDGNTHAGACSGDAKPCDSSADCVSGTCAPDGCSSDCKSNETCGNGIKDLGEVCDDAHAPGGCEDDCLHGVGCDNGVLDPNEQCDDGNSSNTDDCTYPNCTINVCGDGVIDSTGVTHHETCDPGTGGVPLQTASCNLDCTTASCGDGKVNPLFKAAGSAFGEQCDNGTNNADSFACTSKCLINVCGDGLRGPGEDCDSGAANGTSVTVGSCDSQCHVVGCGNGVVDPGEQCDPHNGFTATITTPVAPSATCDSDCTAVVCGDTVTNTVAGEVCDQGVTNNGQPCAYTADTSGTVTCTRCAADCKSQNLALGAPYCGDGNTDPGHEVCDQGSANGTSCPYATSCQRCNATCSALTTSSGPSCGDGIVTTADNEQCDGTNLPKTCAQLGYASGTPTCYAPTDTLGRGCQYNITPCVPTCGNNTVEAGEQCDGTNLNGATCAALGYSGGTPTCTACKVTSAGCTSTCGNNLAEGSEQCDGTDLHGVTCASLGYSHGTNPGCTSGSTGGCKFDVLPCSCGDSVCGQGETTTNCPADCHCGDGTCNPAQGETYATCPVDCPASCTDGFRNGSETGTDCGGTTCVGLGKTCGTGVGCGTAADCTSGVCTGNVCQVASCTDGVKNGNETDTDCGGSCTSKCAATRTCLAGTDCVSGVCSANICQ
jgi:cysteine-rich repeat protein